MKEKYFDVVVYYNVDLDRNILNRIKS